MISRQSKDIWPALAVEPLPAANVALRDVVRRAQSHVVFLMTSVLTDLSEVLAENRSNLATWLSDAANAHSRSVESRLVGDLSIASTCDREVFDNLSRILSDGQGSAPLNSQLSFRIAIPTGSPRLESTTFKIEKSDVRGSHARDVHTWVIPKEDIGQCLDLILTRSRGRLTDEAPLRTVCSVLRAGYRMPTYDRDRIATGTVRPAGLIKPLSNPFLWQSEPDERYTELVCNRAFEDSAVRLLMSSWMFASTVGLLTREYLPRHMRAVEDVVVRIEGDLASCAV
jgi:hypothetical protein